MKYPGGKFRNGKSIAHAIWIEHLRTNRMVLEPFCGALGVARHIAHKFPSYLCGDIHEDLIHLWKAVQEGWEPSQKILDITRDEYNEYRSNNFDGLSQPEKALIGFGGSIFAKYWNGYATGHTSRGYMNEAWSGISRIKHRIKDVEFYNRSYIEWTPLNKIAYCDPPYADSEPYINSDLTKTKFDSSLFWETMMEWSKDNAVFVSEFTIPDSVPHKVIHEWPRNVGGGVNGDSVQKIEKLIQIK